MAWSHKLVLVLAIASAAFIGSLEGRSLKSKPTITPVKEIYQPQTVGIFAQPGTGLGGSGGIPGFSFGTPNTGAFPGFGGMPDAGSLPGFGGMPGMIGGGFPGVGGVGGNP